MQNTWKEEPEKRPSFTKIVQFLHEQNIKDDPVDEVDSTMVDAKNDSGYLDVFQV